jgi:hypothetical protein
MVRLWFGTLGLLLVSIMRFWGEIIRKLVLLFLAAAGDACFTIPQTLGN